MRRLLAPALAVSILGLAPAAHAQSNAAKWLMDQEIAAACGGVGRFDGGVVETDLNGDGLTDLILSHEGIVCGSGGRSGFCGMQVCTVKIYLREGALLQEAEEMLGGGVSVDTATSPPTIRGYAHGGGAWAMRWANGRFN